MSLFSIQGTMHNNLPFKAVFDTFDGAQAPPFRVGKEAPLSVNPEQAPALRLESRGVDCNCAS